MRKKILYIYLSVLLLFSLWTETVSADKLGVSARSAVLMEQNSGRVLYSKDMHTVSRIASITKIMTAILAIESGKWEEEVVVSDEAAGTEGSSLYLKPGEQIQLKHLVYGLMLRSGNDSAVAIAEHVGGSLDGFVYLMNQKAKEIGMKNTHFANPHGLDDHEDHFSTAYDMALLTRYAMNNSIFREVSGTKVYRAPNPESQWEREWRNKNKLLTEKYEYSTGGKTGYTKRAKRTLVSTAEKGDMDLIAVTLNAPDDWNDHISMFEHAFKTYDPKIILKKGTIKAIKEPVYKGRVFVNREVLYPLTPEEEDEVEVEYKVVKPKKEWTKGKNAPEIVGKAIIYFEGREVDMLPIYYNAPKVEENQSFWEQMKDKFFMIVSGG
ncbi:MAG TPA: D-alanyl-D-alanine carboxypeptidase family protein [Chondromyces sp.]|nr:D-alanyl-D-alanine carboxypeptidase family protein [Chondromyces sp.]